MVRKRCSERFRTYLDDAFVLFEYTLCLREVAAQVVRHRERDPILSQLGPQAKQGVACLNESVVKPQLRL